jgi:hypothetical protein
LGVELWWSFGGEWVVAAGSSIYRLGQVGYSSLDAISYKNLFNHSVKKMTSNPHYTTPHRTPFKNEFQTELDEYTYREKRPTSAHPQIDGSIRVSNNKMFILECSQSL